MLKKIALTTFILFVFVTSVSLFLMINYPTLPSSSASTASLSSSTSSFTVSEIKTHNTASSCWLVIKDKIYDVSLFLNQHPGGVENLTSNCGKEASELFSSIHSNKAWNLLGKYYVGDVKK